MSFADENSTPEKVIYHLRFWKIHIFLFPHLSVFLYATMLVLYETALGFCLFKVSDSAKLENADLWKEFESPEKANRLYVCFELHRIEYSDFVIYDLIK